jgi:hypothetical protein
MAKKICVCHCPIGNKLNESTHRCNKLKRKATTKPPAKTPSKKKRK